MDRPSVTGDLPVPHVGWRGGEDQLSRLEAAFPRPLRAVVSLQVDLGVDDGHEEGGQDEGAGEEAGDCRAGDGGCQARQDLTPGPQLAVRLVEDRAEAGHHQSQPPDHTDQDVGPWQNIERYRGLHTSSVCSR